MKSNNIKDFVRKLWHNYVFRNIVLFAIFLVLFVLAVSLLLNLFTRHNSYMDVPDFKGYTIEEAHMVAKTDGLRLEVTDSLYVPLMDPGVILEQRPGAGTQVKSGRRIFLTVNSFTQKMVTVPYVPGYSLRQAKNILETAGIGIGRLVYEDNIATNYVLRQYVVDKEVVRGEPVQAEYGSDVLLVVGREPGAGRVVVPRVTGATLRDAESRLLEMGLNVGRPVNDNDINPRNQHSARVYKQSPEQNSSAELGTTVTLYLTLDSLAVVKGVKASDVAARKYDRERFLLDSLARKGYSGEELYSEAEWIMKFERGELSQEEVDRHMREMVDRERGSRHSEELLFDEDYIREEIPLDDLDDGNRAADSEDDFFF